MTASASLPEPAAARVRFRSCRGMLSARIGLQGGLGRRARARAQPRRDARRAACPSNSWRGKAAAASSSFTSPGPWSWRSRPPGSPPDGLKENLHVVPRCVSALSMTTKTPPGPARRDACGSVRPRGLPSPCDGLLRARDRSRGFTPRGLPCWTSACPGWTATSGRRRCASATGPRFRLMAVMGYGQEQDRVRAERAGFDCHLRNPLAWASFSRRSKSNAEACKRGEGACVEPACAELFCYVSSRVVVAGRCMPRRRRALDAVRRRATDRGRLEHRELHRLRQEPVDRCDKGSPVDVRRRCRTASYTIARRKLEQEHAAAAGERARRGVGQLLPLQLPGAARARRSRS